MKNTRQQISSSLQFTRKAYLSFQRKSFGPCRLKDLKLRGMFIYGEFNKKKGQICQVVLRQTGPSSDLAIKAYAIVDRIDKDGLAIAFTSMGYDSYMFLQTTLLYEPANFLPTKEEFAEDLPFEITQTVPEKSKNKKIIPLYSTNIYTSI